MIEVQELVYRYPGAPGPAVRGLSFNVSPGEIFGFLGPNGAGKSTTQKVLVRLLRDYQGQAWVLGRELRRWGDDLYRHVGVGFELPGHYLKLTARENLRLFAALHDQPATAVEQALAQVDLSAAADRPVGQFSKGMRHRLNLARALLHRPALLFLDEPTAGLDPVNARRIKALIRAQRAAGVTVLLTTHDMQVAEQLCDRVAFLVDGAIALVDTPRALKLRFGRRQVQVELNKAGALETLQFALAGLADNTTFLAALRDESLQTIHTQETSLEEIFIQVTGRSLGEPQ